ncbi:hypothetical protein [Micromonospora pattaloongensis]|uniref:hypothetical protein n=1 Tax=Micromonospora pattaloongensis TaxID=405436 RepID=UPI000B82EA15|nr:hypothetical protein [Micromonospora pattaloongensis]
MLAAVLLAILTVTSIHGATSVAVPAGAIATAHASIGAALVPPTPSVGRGIADESDADGAARQRGDEELPRPEIPPAATASRPSVVEVDDAAATAIEGYDESRRSAPARRHGSRAPPAA